MANFNGTILTTKGRNLPGFKKREKVYEELKKHLDGVADWAIYFLIELWVAWLRAWAAKN